MIFHSGQGPEILDSIQNQQEKRCSGMRHSSRFVEKLQYQTVRLQKKFRVLLQIILEVYGLPLIFVMR